MRKLLFILLGAFSLGGLTPLMAQTESPERTERTFTQYFDTTIDVAMYAAPGADTEGILSGFEDILRDIHRLATIFDEYDDLTNVRTINENPGVDHEVDAHLFEMIQLGKEYYEKTDGYFNIALGPVISIWQERLDMCTGLMCELDREDLPSEEELQEADLYTDIEGITLDEENRTVRIEEGMKLDLGGIAKGYGAKIAADYLKSFDEVEAFILNAGTSNIEVYGDHPEREGGRWKIEFVDPAFEPDIWSIIRGDREVFAEIYIPAGTSIVGSGNYERYFEVDGVRYHHLINPYTLYPSGSLEEDMTAFERFRNAMLCRTAQDHFQGVWLVTDDPLIGDILVTAAYLMPIEDALDYVENLENTEGVFYGADGRIFKTGGFEGELLHGHEWSAPEDRPPCVLPLVVIGGTLIAGGLGTLLYLRIRKKKTNADSEKTTETQ